MNFATITVQPKVNSTTITIKTSWAQHPIVKTVRNRLAVDPMVSYFEDLFRALSVNTKTEWRCKK